MMTVKRAPARPRGGALAALQVLETCPLVPVDVFMHLAGLTSMSAAYQQLARLRRAGLAHVHRVDPGYLVGDRRLGCWTITGEGRRTLAAAADQHPTEQRRWVPQTGRGGRGPQKVSRIAVADAPTLMATYRLLASLVIERGAGGQLVEVEAWEWPWVRKVCPAADEQCLRVKMPAGAILRVREPAMDAGRPEDHLTQVLLVPDLGTAPVVRFREMLRRLIALREQAGFADSSADADLEVVIACSDPDGTGARSRAWLELFDRIGRRHGAHLLSPRVLTWDWVAKVVTHSQLAVTRKNLLRECAQGYHLHAGQ